jgi:hypothetical protein
MKGKIQYICCVIALSLTFSFAANAQTTTQSQKFGANPTVIAPSAVLEIESTNKGVLFPRVSLSSTSDVTTIASPATGLTVFNTATAGTSPTNVTPGYYYWNGTKWVKMAIETPFAKTVYVNAASPSAATIFDENNPPATNDNALKANDQNLYIGTDGSTWTYDPTGTGSYKTFTAPASTPFNLAGTTTDAGSNKTNAIVRTGSVSVTNGFLRATANSNTFTMDPTQGGGPRLMLGTPATPNSYFELGAYNSINNFDTKSRDFNIFSGSRANAIYLKNNTGNVGFGTNSPVAVLDVNSPLSATATVNANGQMLKFTRPTTAGTKFGNVAQFNLGSYAVFGTQALTRLDLNLNNLENLTPSTLVMTWQGNGNVGIGTTAPANRLEINQGTAGNSGLRFTNLNSSSAAATSSSKVLALNSTGDVILANVPGTENIVSFTTATPTTTGVVFTPDIQTDPTVIYQSSIDNSMWTYNGTSYVTYTPPASTAWNLGGTTNDAGNNKTGAIWRNGNVGLGINNPVQRLDVNGGSLLIRRGNNAGSSTWDQILFGLISTNTYQQAIKTRHDNGTAGNAIDFYTWSTNVNTSATEVGKQHVMSLDGLGRVGIGGITGPIAVIDAASNAVATASVNASRKMLRLSIPTAQGAKVGNVAEFNMGSYAIEGTFAKTRLDLLLNDGGDNTVSPTMTWQANGNVGIGTTAPTTTLEVVNTNTTAFQSTINVSSNPSALSSAGFNGVNPDILKASSGIQFLGWNGKKEGGIFRQTGSNDKSHMLFTVNTTNDVAMVINESRNVGIGTTTPSSILHLQTASETQTTPATLRIENSSAPTVNNFAGILFKSTNQSGSWKIGANQQSTTSTDQNFQFLYSNGGNNTLRTVITSAGNMGIGITAPTQRLEVSGNIVASGTVSASGTVLTSDARLKSNIINLDHGLSKIMALRPVNYDKKFDLDSAAAVNEHGFIAQEIQKVMPELVSEGKDKDKLLSVNYTAIIPVLTKAMQEQQALIEANQATIQKQQEQIDELKTLVEKLLKQK